MIGIDFNWLKRQAKNKYTKDKIKELEEKYKLIKNKTKHFIIQTDQKFPLKIGKWSIWLNEDNSFESLDIYIELLKECEHTKLSQFPAKNDLYIVDLGANEGYFTLKIKEKVPKSKIICVEPNPSAFETLKKNIKTNNLKDITLINKAVTSKNGKVSFEILAGASTISGLKIKREKWFDREQIKKIDVDSITLTDLYKKCKLKRIDLLKLDIQGAEMDVLRSSRDVLPNIKKIVVEYHNFLNPKLKKNIKNFLKSNGFKLLFSDKNPKWGDLYFINEKFKELKNKS